jgi:uncharacterized protein
VSLPEPVSPTAPPLPRPRLMTQRWCDVAFLHWAVPPAAVAPLLPPGVVPDVHEGVTYVGLVPFRMVGAGVGTGPAVPWQGTFCETNVRVYSVDTTGRRGVVFLSLDAERLGVVLGAQAVFGLPYRWARMRLHRDGAVRTYSTQVRWPGLRVESHVGVEPGGPAPDGALERFLTARWGLHVAHLGRTWFVPNAHPPWPLRTARVVALDDALLTLAGFPAAGTRPPDHVLFSDGVPVAFGPPTPADRPGR